MDVNGTWVFDEIVIDSSISQDQVRVLDALPIDSLSPVSDQVWIMDELLVDSPVSRRMADHPLQLWIRYQIERLQKNSAFLQEIQEQLIRPELESLTKVFEFKEPVEDDICTICQIEFEGREKIAKLRCEHEFHLECLKKWLLLKNFCPLCKRTALNSL